MSDDFQENFEHFELRAKLKGSLLLFTRTFFKELTGRDFILSNPVGRESHFITVAKALTKCTKLESLRLIINLPPGHAKSTMISFWVAWCMAKYPDSNFLYISYSKGLASSHTETIRRIMTLRKYRLLFGVRLSEDSQAKEHFKTEAGGTICAFGSAGSITGSNAGLPGLDRFSGAVIIDDAHKPDEVSSDTIREGVIDNYRETIMQRPRGVNVPILFIGQRLHESDLPGYLLDGNDGYEWDKVIIKALDDAGNALYPETFPLDMILKKQTTDRYVFASQFQQEPQPAGGGLYMPEDFPLLDEEPKIITTFITADTAETENKRNDATVFSLWGVYDIENNGVSANMVGLHWLECREIWVEPKDLETEFMDFWRESCQKHKTPQSAYIEKKSTGVTLTSILKGIRGLKIREIERTRASGSKCQRFIDIQPYIASKRVSLPKRAKHTSMCVTHMKKITNNDTHSKDDIADTCSDAVNIAIINKLLNFAGADSYAQKTKSREAIDRYKKLIRLKRKSHKLRI